MRRALRFDARVLRVEFVRQPPRHGHAGAQVPRRRDDPLRGRHRQGRPADRVLAGRRAACGRLFGRGRRHYAAPASRVVAEARRRAEAAFGVRDDRDAARAGACAHGTDRRADRHRQAAHAEPGTRPAHARIAAARIRTGRAAFQPGFAQAAAAVAVRRTQAAGCLQDAERPAVDERRSARSARRPARSAAPRA